MADAEPGHNTVVDLSSGEFVDNIVEESRTTGEGYEMVTASPARHIPCAQRITADLREEGFSPESTVPMTMTVLQLESTTPGRQGLETRGPGATRYRWTSTNPRLDASDVEPTRQDYAARRCAHGVLAGWHRTELRAHLRDICHRLKRKDRVPRPDDLHRGLTTRPTHSVALPGCVRGRTETCSDLRFLVRFSNSPPATIWNPCQMAGLCRPRSYAGEGSSQTPLNGAATPRVPPRSRHYLKTALSAERWVSL